jgi:hypothetical protein
MSRANALLLLKAGLAVRSGLGVAVVATIMALSCGAANASMTITNATTLDEKQITDTGGCIPVGCIPIGQTGYIVDNQAPNLVVTAGTYMFTYLGAGDSIDNDAFTVTGSGVTFCTQSYSNCNGGAQTAIGTSFTMTMAAGDIPFVFTASQPPGPNGTTGCVLTNGSTTNALPNSGCADYFVGLGNSTTTPGLTSPAEYTAFIGLTDLPFPGDHDFQDLAVEVTQVPEPVTLAVFGVAMLGLTAARRRRALVVG